jgi:hypothetical protein
MILEMLSLETEVLVDALHGPQTHRDEIVQIHPNLGYLLDLFPLGAAGKALFFVASLHKPQIDIIQFLGRMQEGSVDYET